MTGPIYSYFQLSNEYEEQQRRQAVKELMRCECRLFELFYIYGIDEVSDYSKVNLQDFREHTEEVADLFEEIAELRKCTW